jgi:iron(III) transport system ATP-binding protein
VVRARDAEDGYYVIDTELGALRSLSVDTVNVGDKVILSIRPEDLRLSEQKPDSTLNVLHAVADQKVFLGEAMDWQLKVGARTLLSRTHPSIRTPIGQPLWAQIDASKCVAMPAAAELKAAA